MQHIFITRHGQTHDNAHKIVSGSRETPLTELGIQQAHIAGKKARGTAFDFIVCSPLSRAQKTAHIIAEEIGYPATDIIVMPEFTERDLGKLEGVSFASNEKLNGQFPAVDHILGVEPLATFHSRVQNGLRQLLHDKTHHTILIVCHIGVGKMLRTIIEGKKLQAVYDQPRLENATIYPLT